MRRNRNAVEIDRRGVFLAAVAVFLVGCDNPGSPPPPPPPPPPSVVSVTVTPPSLSLTTGGATGQLSAAVVNTDGPVTSPTVAWSSDAGSVATVAGSGANAVVTPVGAGSATITATSGGKSGTSTITVTDPLPVVTISASDPDASEVGQAPGAFTIARTGSTTAALAVNLTVGGTASSGADYTAITSPQTIPAGQASLVVAVTPEGDALVEGPETVVLSIATGGYQIGAASSATVTIADTPPPTVVSVTVTPPTLDLTVGGATGQLTAAVVASDGPVANPVVSWTSSAPDVATVAGTGATATVTPLTAGTATITATSGDKHDAATITVTAASTLPVVTMAATDPDASEAGADPGTVAVTRTGATTSALVVNLSIAGTATNGTDYLTIPSTVTIPSGQASATITVTPISDATAEASETVQVTLVASASYSIGATSSATVTIADAPPPATPVVTVVATDAAASEAGADPGTFTLARSGATTAALVVNLSIAGTATNGTDYNAIAATATIPIGQATTTVPVTPKGDGVTEGSETVILTIAAGAAYTIGAQNTATVTIADNVVVAGSLVNGFRHTGTLIFAHETQIWTFTATKGDYVAIALAETVAGGDLVPWLRVTGPTGATIVNSAGAAVAEGAFNAPTSGTYTVTVATDDPGQDAVGDYTITLAKGPGALTLSPGDQGGSMINGTIHTGSLYVGDLDVWTFAATQGEYIALNLAETVAGADIIPWVRVVGPTGALIINSAGAAVAEGGFNAPATGTYTVIVATDDPGFDAVGDYTVTLAKGPGALTLTAGDQGGDLADGATYPGSLYVGDLDIWTFTATQGDYVAVNVAETVAGADIIPWVRVVGPTGALIINNAGAAVAEGGFNAPATGTYTVIVATDDPGFDAVGDYSITLAKGPGAVTVSPGDQGGPMTNGAIHPGSLYLGDLDTWTFTATQGDYVAVNVAEAVAGAEIVPWLRVVGPTGALIINVAGAAVAEGGFNAPATGTYTVIVGSDDPGFDAVGDYNLTLAKAPGAFTLTGGDQGGAMASGTSYDGQLYLGDLDIWTFTAAAGAHLVVTATEGVAGSDLTPWIRIVGPTGALVVNQANAASVQGQFTAPATGTYTVIVTTDDPGFDAVGSYSIMVTGASALRAAVGRAPWQMGHVLPPLRRAQ